MEKNNSISTPKQITNDRMFRLIDYWVRQGHEPDETSVLKKICFTPSNISNVRKGIQSFSRDHLFYIAELTGATLNWIYGLENNMFRKEVKDPLERMKQLAIELESMLVKEKILKKNR